MYQSNFIEWRLIVKSVTILSFKFWYFIVDKLIEDFRIGGDKFDNYVNIHEHSFTAKGQQKYGLKLF